MSYNFDLERFIQLQSLTLSTINCEETMNKLCYLSQLRCLNIIDCHFQSSYIDNIWFIPKLIRCELNTISNFDCSNVPTIKSFSLQYFSISKVPLTKFSIEHLFEFTLCLQHLIIDFFVFSPSENLTRTISTIERLSLAFLNSSNKLENILQNISNVSKLTVRTWRDIYRNGYQWENLISNYLPKLKVFNLLMQFDSDDDDINGEEQVDKILDSFQTQFWIDKHRWFVRCHWQSKSFSLYTLPYVFRRFTIDIDTQFKSTCIEDNTFSSYNHVKDISFCHSLSPDFVHLRFLKLYDLCLVFPIQNEFLSIIPTLHYLTSLIIDFKKETSISFPLQVLLDRAYHLYSLNLKQDSTLHMINLRSKSIRHLHFSSHNKYFNQQERILLSQSPMGMQCEVLRIQVKDKTNIIYLLNKMKNLRSLCFSCENIQSQNELIECLKQKQLDVDFAHFIRLWIR
ncbi:unnamed protein product [Adineta steineri]|uniref:F-box domain-containing protein n=1 Tax=Adineta steineri TaxID=433720 RepID=A0A819Z7G7_9BILA|nr:unnamed protein product [Adineta steineri]CAF4164379.1 unnamed protein product [Adineta steineri]